MGFLRGPHLGVQAAIIGADNFNRPDGPLGNAQTGQPWQMLSGLGDLMVIANHKMVMSSHDIGCSCAMAWVTLPQPCLWVEAAVYSGADIPGLMRVCSRVVDDDDYVGMGIIVGQVSIETADPHNGHIRIAAGQPHTHVDGDVWRLVHHRDGTAMAYVNGILMAAGTIPALYPPGATESYLASNTNAGLLFNQEVPTPDHAYDNFRAAGLISYP